MGHSAPFFSDGHPPRNSPSTVALPRGVMSMVVREVHPNINPCGMTARFSRGVRSMVVREEHSARKLVPQANTFLSGERSMDWRDVHPYRKLSWIHVRFLKGPSCEGRHDGWVRGGRPHQSASMCYTTHRHCGWGCTRRR